VSYALLLQVADPQQISSSTLVFVVATIVKMLVIFTIYMVGVALLTLAERKISAWIQDRHGPNRVGPGGLLQPAADGLKNIMKEETYPDAAYKPLFVLAPAFSFIPALLAWAVIPFASPLPTPWGLIPMVVADLPIGFLYILAISSLGVYGIVLAGWSSNNKYSLLGGLRSSAQMISYEVAMGLSLVAVLMYSGHLSFSEVVAAQDRVWNVVPMFPAFVVYLICAIAETNRPPFDLAEAETELVAGFHTEYSGITFAMFFLGEYVATVTVAAIGVTLFLGGWRGPAPDFLPWLWPLLWFVFKVTLVIYVLILIRATLPRVRYDRLMAFGWKVLIPFGLVWVLITGAVVVLPESLDLDRRTVLTWAAIALGVMLLLSFLPIGRSATREEVTR
jgi:NADH-quinone oxidoreductase subunit H